MLAEELIRQADEALTKNDLVIAKELILRAENELLGLEKSPYIYFLDCNLGGILIDYGSWTKSHEIIKRGIAKIEACLEKTAESNKSVYYLYNLANGYAALRKLSHKEAFIRGRIPDEYVEEKDNYRKAIHFALSRNLNEFEKQVLPDLFTNYASCLDDMGRSVEALDYYNLAISQNPKKPEALGNKAITLHLLAPYAHGHKHLFILEAKRLLEMALENSPHPQLSKVLLEHKNQIEKTIFTHGQVMQIEKYKSSPPKSDFHKFLRGFCIKHQLYLTPTTLIGIKEHQFLGDPLFFNGMRSDLNNDEKIERYISFFNQIKQDYVFARYLLVQSQYQADHAEVIDQDVDYFYPLDYSITSSYGEMKKISYKLAVDTLDKIAFFIKDYCNLTLLDPKNVYFTNVFSSKEIPNELRTELKPFVNKYLFALMDLATDMNKDGFYYYINDRRNAITHRFVSIHSETITMGKKNKDIPCFSINEFENELIKVLQLLKSAIIYLIIFVDKNERKNEPSEFVLPVFFDVIDKSLRWKPNNIL